MTGVLPHFVISYVERVREQLDHAAFTPHLGVPLTDDHMRWLVASIVRALPHVREDTIMESLRHLAGRTLTTLDIAETSWRLAGNLSLLQEGLPVRPWSQQRADEWVPLQILGLVPGRDRRGRPGHHFSFRALAGTPCPMTLYTFWGRGACGLIAREIGFSKPWDKFPFHRPSDLVGLRLLAGIEAVRSATYPTFFEVRGPSAFVRWNRDTVLRLRFRVGMACPEGFTHACSACAVGYRECSAGTHLETYQLRFCDGCGHEAYFDPERHADHCVECDNRERMRAAEGVNRG